MPRVREFDPEEALAKAMQVFWRSGYTDTSMEDIVSETGVSRYGLYGTFGGKMDLLLAAMRHYKEMMNDLVWADMMKPDAGLAEIVGLWQKLDSLSEVLGTGDGCLIVTLAAEVAPHEPKVAAEIKRIDKEHSDLFARAIRNGQKSGDIPSDLDAGGAARMMMTLIYGGALMLRAGGGEAALDGVIETALRILHFPETKA